MDGNLLVYQNFRNNLSTLVEESVVVNLTDSYWDIVDDDLAGNSLICKRRILGKFISITALQFLAFSRAGSLKKG